jgi:hypothetical protein
MSWLTRILGRDHAEERIADAHLQRADAARDLDETREVVRRVRRLEQDNFTGGGRGGRTNTAPTWECSRSH